MVVSFLARTALFHGIAEDEIQRLYTCLEICEKHYARGTVIYRAGDVVDRIGLIAEGSVHIMVNSRRGVGGIFGHMEKGDLFAEAYAALPDKELLCDVVACEDCTVLFLPIERAISPCRRSCPAHIRLIQNLIRISAARNLRLSNRMMHITPRTIRERLLSYLSEQMALHGDPHFIIPFDRQQLSAYLGVDRSALSHELSKMQKEGLLTVHKNEFILHESLSKRRSRA